MWYRGVVARVLVASAAATAAQRHSSIIAAEDTVAAWRTDSLPRPRAPSSWPQTAIQTATPQTGSSCIPTIIKAVHFGKAAANYKNIRGLDVDACGKSCCADPDCAGFTVQNFADPSTRICHLKNGNMGLEVKDPLCVSGTIPARGPPPSCPYPYGPPFSFCGRCGANLTDCTPKAPRQSDPNWVVNDPNFQRELDFSVSYFGPTVAGGATDRCDAAFPADPGPFSDPDRYPYTTRCWIHATNAIDVDRAGHVISFTNWDEAHATLQAYTPDGKVVANAWPDPMDPWGMYGCGNGPCYLQVAAQDYIYTFSEQLGHVGDGSHPCFGVARWTNNFSSPDLRTRLNPSPFSGSCGQLSNIFATGAKVTGMALCGDILHVAGVNGTSVVVTIDTTTFVTAHNMKDYGGPAPKSSSWNVSLGVRDADRSTPATPQAVSLPTCGQVGSVYAVVGAGQLTDTNNWVPPVVPTPQIVVEFSGLALRGLDPPNTVPKARTVMVAQPGLSQILYDPKSNTLFTANGSACVYLFDASTGQQVTAFGSDVQAGSELTNSSCFDVKRFALSHSDGLLIVNCGQVLVKAFKLVGIAADWPRSPAAWAKIVGSAAQQDRMLLWDLNTGIHVEGAGVSTYGISGDEATWGTTYGYTSAFKWKLNWGADSTITSSTLLASTRDAHAYPSDVRSYFSPSTFPMIIEDPTTSCEAEVLYYTPGVPAAISAYALHRHGASNHLSVPCFAMGTKGDAGYQTASKLGCCPNSSSYLWMWNDLDDDGQMKATEFSAPRVRGTQPGYAKRVAEDGSLWMISYSDVNGPAQPPSPDTAAAFLHGWRLHSVSAGGCPVYAPTPSYTIALFPEPFVSARYPNADIMNFTQWYTNGDASYIPHLDSILITGFDSARPFKIHDIGYFETGSTMCMYKAPAPSSTPVELSATGKGHWCLNLTYTDAYHKGDATVQHASQPHGLAISEKCAFYKGYEEFSIRVIDIEAGNYMGVLNISSSPNASSTGRWIGASDVQYPLHADRAPDGSTIVTLEDDLFQRSLVYVLPRGTCAFSAS